MVLVNGFNSVQPQLPPLTLFCQILDQVWITSSRNITATADRKACAIAFSRILTEIPELRQGQFAATWANTLVALLHLMEMPPHNILAKSNEEVLADLEEAGYSSSASKLAYAQTEMRDSFKEVESPQGYFITLFADATAKAPGTYTEIVRQTLEGKPNSQAAITRYCQQYGKTLV